MLSERLFIRIIQSFFNIIILSYIIVFRVNVFLHIIFVLGAGLFFILQFLRTKRWYQLVMAAAFAVSLLIYADSENEKLRHTLSKSEFDGKRLALTTQIAQGQHEKMKSRHQLELSPVNIMLMQKIKFKRNY